MKVKNILLAVLVIGLVIVLEIITMGYYQKSVAVEKNPIVTMELEKFGTVKMELYPELAPNTVLNFIKLVEDKFYDGLTFDRVIPDVLIQGGQDLKDEEEKQTFAIKGEFFVNGFEKNDLNHLEGTVSMARADYTGLNQGLATEGYNSADTQFFISVTNTTGYNGTYAAFGRVIEGLDLIKDISNLKTTKDNNEEPVEQPVIKSMTVETFGVEYDEPERIAPFDIDEYVKNMYSNTNSIIIPE